MASTIKCIIIDDEPLARELLKSYVDKTPALSLEGSFESGAEAIKTVMSGEIDIIFLDINMPMLNGIEFARVIPERTRIIYVTAYEQYALQGFRVNALDYLLKPVNYAEFTRAVGKATQWMTMRDSFERTNISEAQSGNRQASGASTPRITIKSESRLIQMQTDSILFIEVQNDRVIFHRKDSEPVTSLTSLKEIEELLPTDRFMRVHRSFIVNMDNIEVVERNRIIFGKTYIPIADSKRDEFFSRLTGSSE